MTNPYSPPEAAVADRRPPDAWSPVAAVLLGLAIDILGSLALGIVLAMIRSFMFATSGMSTVEIARRLAEAPSMTSWDAILGMVLGCAFSMLGGFAANRKARRADLKLGFIMGPISALFGLALGSRAYPAAMNVLLAAATVGVVVLGARLGIVRPANIERPDE